MATRQQRVEARLQRLKAEKEKIDQQIGDAQQVLRTSERKRRTRQAIIGWETLMAVVGKLGEPVTFRNLGDVEAFLDRYVQGESNRQTWGLQPPANGNVSADNVQKRPKVASSVEPAPITPPTPYAAQAKATSAPRKPLREAINQDDLAKEFL